MSLSSHSNRVALVGLALAGCAGAPAAPADPLTRCQERTWAGDRVGAREAVEAASDVRVAAAPLGEAGALAMFGVSTPGAESLWSVTIEVKALPAGAHLLVEPPRFSRQCVETSARWEPMWPSLRESIFPIPEPLPRSRPSVAAVLPAYEVVEAPAVIKPGDVALWEKLEEVTGKPRSRKHKYKLTQEEQSAWRESEEARRAATQTAREHALAQNQESRQAFEAEVARHDAAVEAAAAARATLGTLSSVRCDPPQSIGPGQIVFATAARCSYVSMPTESQPPPGGAACAKPVSFSVAAQWGLDAPGGASCVADGSASLVLPDDATPADLQALFAEGPVQLARLRRDR